MLYQIMLGSVLLLISSMISGITAMAMLGFFRARAPWFAREPHDLRLIAAMMVASLWVMLIVTVSISIWATAFRLLGIFTHLEEAVYFGLVVFTTLGFGDLLLPTEWRILGGVMAVNGLLNVGIMTAIMMETLRGIRGRQKSD